MKLVIKVSTQMVIEKLKANKEAHIAEYANQLAGWKLQMDEYSKHLSDWAVKGGVAKERKAEPLKPDNYVKEYDNLLEILSYHIDDSVELSEEDFEKVIRNRFHWSKHFLANSTTYSVR